MRHTELVQRALEHSRSDDCLVLLHDSRRAELRWATNTLTTNGVGHAVEVTVVAFQGEANASVSGSAASLDQVVRLVEAADAAAAEAEPARDRAPLQADRVSPDFEDPAETTGIEVFGDFARSLGAEFDRAHTEHELLYGFVQHRVTTSYLASSTGLRLRHVQPEGYYGCTGKDAELTSSAWVGGATRDFTDVDAHELATTLSRRIEWGRRREALPAGRYDALLPPAAVADLLVDAYWSAGARTAHEGQSAYSRRGGGTLIGEEIARPGVILRSDPAYAGLQCAPFVMDAASTSVSSVYDNGLPLAGTRWIDDGRLAALLQTRETASLTGQPVTPGIDNLVLEVAGAEGDLDALAAQMDDGLLLTCLWYIREVDPQSMLVTGLTRDGVYRVRGGEVVGAVNNFRFNESPLDLLRRFTAASATVPTLSREWGEDFLRTAMPALRVPDFNMSSVSQAL